MPQTEIYFVQLSAVHSLSLSLSLSFPCDHPLDTSTCLHINKHIPDHSSWANVIFIMQYNLTYFHAHTCKLTNNFHYRSFFHLRVFCFFLLFSLQVVHSHSFQQKKRNKRNFFLSWTMLHW